jgi:hypothetical protein
MNIQENYQVVWKWEWQNFGMIKIISWNPFTHHVEHEGVMQYSLGNSALKHWYTPTTLRGVTSWKTAIFTPLQ